MRLKRIWINALKIAALAGFGAIIILVMALFAPKPPVAEMEYARVLLSEAQKSKAASYSTRLFNEAEDLYDSAMTAWKEENKRFIFFRNYDKVSEFAELSAQKAEQASQDSKTSSSSLQTKLKHKIDSVNSIVADLDRFFLTYPLPAEIRGRISRGKLLLKESEIAFKKGEFLHANSKMIDSEYLLSSSYEHATTNLAEYFRLYPEWKKWADRTIKESRQNSDYSIIVDKFSRKCLVYLNGTKKYEYDIELGDNWAGHKRIKGDRATPEGMYRVTKKIGPGRTKYYKALLLDYPNSADREEFRKEIAKGTLPATAKLGGLIEIHGSGGRGIDWTEGCVALTDSDMDVIYRIARVGTPVTIVGSLTDLHHIIK